MTIFSIVGATGDWGTLRGDLHADNDVDFADLAPLASQSAERVE